MTILRKTRPGAALAALALVLAACGGSATTTATQDATPEAASPDAAPSKTGTPTVQKIAYSDSILAEAAAAQHEVTTGRFEIRTVADVPEAEGAITLTGAFDTARDLVQVTVDFSQFDLTDRSATDEGDGIALDLGNLFAEPMTIINVGEDTYMSGGFTSILGASDGEWLRLDSDDAGSMADEMPGDFGSPQDMFDEFRDHDMTVTEVGSAIYDGVNTTEYEITSDDPSVSTMRIWVGDDDLIRHFETTQHPDKADGGEVTLVGDLFGYGDPVSIEAPAPDTIVEGFDFGD